MSMTRAGRMSRRRPPGSTPPARTPSLRTGRRGTRRSRMPLPRRPAQTAARILDCAGRASGPRREQRLVTGQRCEQDLWLTEFHYRAAVAAFSRRLWAAARGVQPGSRAAPISADLAPITSGDPPQVRQILERFRAAEHARVATLHGPLPPPNPNPNPSPNPNPPPPVVPSSPALCVHLGDRDSSLPQARSASSSRCSSVCGPTSPRRPPR